MAEQSGARQRLAKLVRDARVARNLSVRRAAQEAGVDRATWAGIEDGTRAPRDTSVAGVERVVGWAAGSVDAILSGGDPIPDSEPLPSDPAEWFIDEEVVDEAERRILGATNAELVEMFRDVEALPNVTRAFAGQWLVDALDMRDRARQRKEATKRNAS